MTAAIDEKVQELYDQGYCILPAFYSEGDLNAIRRAMDAVWERNERPSLDGFGMGIHPVFEQMPDIAPLIAHKDIIAIIASALRDEVRLTHSGARLSQAPSGGENPPLSIDWHEHYAHGHVAWPLENLPKRDRIERVLSGIYVDGSTREVGPLVVLPRRYDDPLGAPLGGLREDWPGQVELDAPPGSVAIFDTALWHTARFGTQSRMRRLIGGHYQGWHDPRPHTEDNVYGTPELDSVIAQNPTLRGLLKAPEGRSLAGAGV